jgi:hypothetical protein
MNAQSFRKLSFTGVVIVVLLVTFGMVYKPGTSANSNPVIKLQRPPFVGIASAGNALACPAGFGEQLDSEAGISAYYKSPDAITLSQVVGQFRTIEVTTTDYIIGSVAVPNYVINFDAHVYVHKNGWILAYYLRSDPTSKILDVKALTINTTKLKTVVAAIASAAGAPFTDVTYYDFRYPNATNMMLIAKGDTNGNDYTIQLPSSYGYFDRGWALRHAGWGGSFYLDGTNKAPGAWSIDYAYYGTLTASELAPDVVHTIVINSTNGGAYSVVIITYRVP